MDAISIIKEHIKLDWSQTMTEQEVEEFRKSRDVELPIEVLNILEETMIMVLAETDNKGEQVSGWVGMADMAFVYLCQQEFYEYKDGSERVWVREYKRIYNRHPSMQWARKSNA